MKLNRLDRKRWLRFLGVMATTLFSYPLQATDIDILAGGYAFSAESENGTGSLSGLGLYRFNYNVPVFSKFKAVIGYTILASNTIGGDLSYGLDIGTTYFPMTSADPIQIKTPDGSNLSVKDLWRPYVGAGFHQRQIQSVESNYAGFSLSGGVIRALDYEFDLKVDLRYVILQGSSTANGSELALTAGINYSF